MLTVICGEDNVASRNYFLELVEKYKKQGFEMQKISPYELEPVFAQTSESPDLFGVRRVFVTENLSKLISRKTSDKNSQLLEKLDKTKEIELLDWEDGVSKRDLKIKNLGKIKEFKPGKNIFQLLDSCYPSNLKFFLNLLDSISTAQNEMFIFIMLQRHLKTLLLIKLDSIPTTLQSWQIGKLKSQAGFWKEKNLISFYDGFYKIDSSLKTGRNPHGIKRSLDILSCYYLK